MAISAENINSVLFENLTDGIMVAGADGSLIAMNRALHHVWEGGIAPFLDRLRGQPKPGGAAVIWEPNWPDERVTLRQPGWARMAFQNLTEHVQGNHLLGAEEIAAAFLAAGFRETKIHLFAEGQEAVIVARAP